MTRAEHSQRARKNGPERVLPATVNFGGTDLPCSRSGISRDREFMDGGFDPGRTVRISIRQDVLPTRPSDIGSCTINGERFTIQSVNEPPHASCWELVCTKVGSRR